MSRSRWLERRPLGLHSGKGRPGVADLLGEAQPGGQPAISLHQVIGEIGAQADPEDGTDDEPRAPAYLVGDRHAA